jgi:cell division protein FtsB
MRRPGHWLIAGLALVVVALQIRLWVGEGSLAQVSALKSRVTQMRVENGIREQRNSILRAEIIELKSGLESIEEKARSEFGLIKQGETFFLLVDENKAQRP